MEDSKEIHRGIEYPDGELEQVYTNNLESFNVKPRLIYCQYCKFKIYSILMGAKCKKCDSFMITLL